MSFQDIPSGNVSKRSSLTSSSPTQDVAAGIFQINTAVSGFRRLVDSMGTSKDTPDHRQKLQATRQKILQLVKETSAKLKSIAHSDRAANAFASPSKRIEDAKLARDFQTILEEFQKVQQLASERESMYSPFVPPSSLSTVSGFDEHLASSAQQENQPFLMEQKRQEVLLLGNEISFNEAIIEERDQGIKDIQDQIGEASEIFKDLAVLVHEQGVIIDDIQSNIEDSSAVTVQARVQLSKASKSGKSKSSWCWWVLAIVVVVLVIILLILIL